MVANKNPCTVRISLDAEERNMYDLYATIGMNHN